MNFLSLFEGFLLNSGTLFKIFLFFLFITVIAIFIEIFNKKIQLKNFCFCSAGATFFMLNAAILRNISYVLNIFAFNGEKEDLLLLNKKIMGLSMIGFFVTVFLVVIVSFLFVLKKKDNSEETKK